VIDTNDDNFLQDEEFLTALKQLGETSMTMSDIRLMY
jgi:hypothetical protein